mmetsp:Transcript_106155/g.193108  ORF Transcript_106155/g.193108 Transcript_106155/m.193108 type:complete len:355 (-) Transcript_106155:32-1096(-)
MDSSQGDAKAPVTLWRYAPANDWCISPRMRPDINSEKLDAEIYPGDTVAVCQELKGEDGLLYLQLTEGKEGWLFDRKPDVGVMCVRDVPEAAEDCGDIVKVEEMQTILDVLQDESLLTFGLPRFEHASLLCLLANSSAGARRRKDLMELHSVLSQVRTHVEKAIHVARDCLIDMLTEIEPDRVLAAARALQERTAVVQSRTAREQARLASVVRLVLQYSHSMRMQEAMEVELCLATQPHKRTEEEISGCDRAISTLMSSAPRKKDDAKCSDSSSRPDEPLWHVSQTIGLAFPEADLLASFHSNLCAKEAMLQKVEPAIAVAEKLLSKIDAKRGRTSKKSDADSSAKPPKRSKNA